MIKLARCTIKKHEILLLLVGCSALLKVNSVVFRLIGERLNDIALLNKSSQSYEASLAMGSPVTCHPTQVNTPHLSRARQAGTWLTYPRRDKRLSWPRWLGTYRDGLPVSRQSSIPVVTVPGVEQLRWSRPTCYHYTMLPPRILSTTHQYESFMKPQVS